MRPRTALLSVLLSLLACTLGCVRYPGVLSQEDTDAFPLAAGLWEIRPVDPASQERVTRRVILSPVTDKVTALTFFSLGKGRYEPPRTMLAVFKTFGEVTFLVQRRSVSGDRGDAGVVLRVRRVGEDLHLSQFEVGRLRELATEHPDRVRVDSEVGMFSETRFQADKEGFLETLEYLATHPEGVFQPELVRLVYLGRVDGGTLSPGEALRDPALTPLSEE